MNKNKHYDIIVAGGGSAGTAAAVAAAGRGSKVLLVEETNALGGCSTSGLVNEWFANTSGLGDIFAYLYRELDKCGLSGGGRMFNGETLKGLWQWLCQQAGVEVLFHASVIEATGKTGQLTGVKIVACSQMIEATAKYFIDATGEGDLAFLAGAEFMKGHPENGMQLHMSLIFHMVKSPRPVVPYLPEGMTPYDSIDELPGLKVHLQLEDGRVYCNTTKIMKHDSTSPWDLSSAEAEARIQMMKIVHFLQRDRFKDYIPAASGSTIGIREGRRIIGDYILTAEDIINGCNFDDGTVVATSQIDFHSLSKEGNTGWRKRVAPYSIPFRCLYSRDFANLLVAGKCISTDQIAHSSCRMTPTCCGMGQTVGIAAAMAVQTELSNIRDLPVKELQSEMVQAGFELSPAKHLAFGLGQEGKPECCL